MYYINTKPAYTFLKTMPPRALVIYDAILNKIDFISTYPKQFPGEEVNGYVKLDIDKISKAAWVSNEEVVEWVKKFEDIKYIEIDGDIFVKEVD